MPSPAPETNSPLTPLLERGAAQFAYVWRQFAAQWTETELMRMASTYLGRKFIHSSTIQTLAAGGECRVRVLAAVGYLNVGLARAVNHPNIEPLDDSAYEPLAKCVPLRYWAMREPIVDADGIALGPIGLYELLIGHRRLPVESDRRLASEDATAASQAAGAFLRKAFINRGIDWVSDLPDLATQCPQLVQVMTGETVRSELLLARLPLMASLAQANDVDLWEHIRHSLGR